MTLVHASKRMVFLLGMGLLLTQLHCPSEGGFECGVDPGNGVRVCNRAHEVCVCATNSCALRDDSCTLSGLRYSNAPFARPMLAGSCVEPNPGAWIIEENAVQNVCPVRADAGVPIDPSPDAGEGGSSGAGGMAGSGGMGSSSSSNSSGMGGTGGMGGMAGSGGMGGGP